MNRSVPLSLAFAVCLSSFAMGQSKPKPDINESKEYSGVYHSPSAQSTPIVFRSVLQLEIAVKEAQGEAAIRYANGVVVGENGLMVCVLDEPNSELTEDSIQSASVLLLNGGAADAQLVRMDPSHGLAVFRAPDLDLPALQVSDRPLIAKRRLSWHAVYRDGRRTWLYSRPLQIHKAKLSVGDTDDLCEIIDTGSSALNADRSGSALLSLDGTLVAVMGRQPHWNVSPKNELPRTKVAWAVPAQVISAIVAESVPSE